MNSNQIHPLFFNVLKGDFCNWLNSQILPNTRLIIEPNIIGLAIALQYENGILRKVLHKKGTLKVDTFSSFQAIPKRLPYPEDIHIRGQIYNPSKNIDKSFASSFKNISRGFNLTKEVSFCAFQIFNSKLNHYSELLQLQSKGFEVPECEFTKKNVNEVFLYHKLWKENKLFTKYPNDGLVIKVNSRKFQKQLGVYQNSINWAHFL